MNDDWGSHKMNFSNKRKILPTFVISIIAILTLCLFAYAQKTNLAGNVVFPENEYNEWLRIQLDPNLEAEDKIKSTVNSFFLIKYESWVKGTLLDFGFLFDEANPQACEDYAYERGLMHYLLEGWKLIDNLLIVYEYTPKFYDLKTDGKKATVAMRPKASIFRRISPDREDNGPWTVYTISLELLSGHWLIRSIQCDDELHESCPHGTDFEQLASALPDEWRKWDAKVESAHQGRMQNDPRYREFIEKRRKARQEHLIKQRQEEEERLQIYNEIAGVYIFKFEGKVVLISFYVQGRYLVGKQENEPEEIVLHITEGNPLKFKFRPLDGNVYKLKFERDISGMITKCLLTFNMKEYEGLKK